MSGPRVLLAGAAGHLGRHLAPALAAQGYRVRALTRREVLPPEVAAAVEGHVVHDARVSTTMFHALREVETIVSTMGASLELGLGHGRASYAEVDRRANLRLLSDAQRAGVKRFCYVSLHKGRELSHTEYAWAHEKVVDGILDSGLAPLIVRPTGFFWSFAPVLRMARRGWGVVLDGGAASTNPVHEADVAGGIARALAEGVEVLSMGGPDVLTRREIVELAARAWGREDVRVVETKASTLRRTARWIRPFHPRTGDLLEFAAEVSTTDVVAPVWSERTLADYFAARVEEQRGEG